MRLTSVIVENELKMREVLTELMHKYCPEIEIVGQASNIDEAYTIIVEKKPKVVLLDIEMPGGNGFELLNKFNPIFFETIFVTSYGHYSIRALRLSALDYLLKPVLAEELQKLPMRIRDAIEIKEKALKYQLLQKNLSPLHKEKNILLSTKTKFLSIIVDQIVYLKANDNYTEIYTSDGNKMLVTKTLKEFEDTLCEPDGLFMRIHKAHIINTKLIKSLERGDLFYVILEKGIRLEVSRRKRAELSKLLNTPC